MLGHRQLLKVRRLSGRPSKSFEPTEYSIKAAHREKLCALDRNWSNPKQRSSILRGIEVLNLAMRTTNKNTV